MAEIQCQIHKQLITVGIYYKKNTYYKKVGYGKINYYTVDC